MKAWVASHAVRWQLMPAGSNSPFTYEFEPAVIQFVIYQQLFWDDIQTGFQHSELIHTASWSKVDHGKWTRWEPFGPKAFKVRWHRWHWVDAGRLMHQSVAGYRDRSWAKNRWKKSQAAIALWSLNMTWYPIIVIIVYPLASIHHSLSLSFHSCLSLSFPFIVIIAYPLACHLLSFIIIASIHFDKIQFQLGKDPDSTGHAYIYYIYILYIILICYI